MTKQELFEKRANLWENTKKFLDSHTDENGKVSAKDYATYEKMEADVDDYTNQIEALERQEVMDKKLSAPLSTPITSRPSGDITPKEIKGRGSKEYKDAFWNMLRDNVTPEIKDSLKIGVDGDGGYLVPDEFEKQLIEALDEECIFRQHANIIHTSSGERKIPISATKGNAAWLEEEQLVPESDDTFGQITLGAHKLGTLIKVSDELMHDSIFDIQAYIAKEFTRRIGNREEEAFFVGDGTGKPVGILDADGGGQIGITTSGGDLTFDDVMDLYYSLKAPYRTKAKFYLNDATVKAIRKLKDNNGNYLWQPSVQAGQPDKILNCAYYTSPYMPSVASEAKAIAFGDFSYYWIAEREGYSFKRLNELFATTGQVGFMATERIDGKLILPEAVKILQVGKTTTKAS